MRHERSVKHNRSSIAEYSTVAVACCERRIRLWRITESSRLLSDDQIAVFMWIPAETESPPL